MYELEFTFEYQSVDARDVLYTLDKLCPKIGLSTKDYSTAYQVKMIEAGGHLDLSGKLFTDIHGGSIANCGHDFLIIKSEGVTLSELVHFVELVVAELPTTQAFIHNYDYYYWQNAEDPRLYEIAGKDHSFLPKKSNGLPPPLEQVVVDISSNPGRYDLRDGYRETVSSPMWVSLSLVQNAVQLEEIATVSRFNGGNLIRIVTSYQPFDSAEGAQGELQRQLRKAIYGRE